MDSSVTNNRPVNLPFGAVIGVATGGVPAYSSDYDQVDPREYPNRHAFRNYVDGVYTGYKWQCVEFARRWLLINRGYVFDDVAMAYDIFRLANVTVVATGEKLPLHAFRNGSRRRPEPGALLIWKEGGMFELTGHVAVITEVTDSYVRVAEQNVTHRPWPEGADWSRQLDAHVGEDGNYWIRCSHQDGEILGWVMQTDDPTDAVVFPPERPELMRILPRQAPRRGQHRREWLNLANPEDAAFVSAMGGHRLATEDADLYRWFAISATAEAELRRATNELHAMFLRATDHVLQDDGRLERFNIPQVLWPRIHQSWDNRRTQMITARFDFCLTEEGLKVYEYNCDSASCHFEAGRAQGAWARHFGVEEGRDPGGQLWERLVAAWKKSEARGTVHLMIDDDPEELYHGLYMKTAIEAAGLRPKVIRGLEGLGWGADGAVLDPEGEPIRWVWKSWAWETALDQLRAEADEDAQRQALAAPRAPRPRLMDVLFQPETMVFEPLWTLIPSNKAILPVLWELFPESRYLLETGFRLTEGLRRRGHVSKPIAGRCGQNVRIVPGADADGDLAGATEGRFDDQDRVWQELAPLPKVGRHFVQICTFSAAGNYAGACVRADRSPIITGQSDVLPLRVLDDHAFNQLPGARGRRDRA